MATKDTIADRRFSKQKQTLTSRDIGDEADSGNPLVHLMYEFLTVPSSSRVANIWALLTCWMVVVRVIEIGLESCDGPNQYYHRAENRARFKFLLTAPQYWDIYIACMVPLIVDSFARLVTLCFVIFGDENVDLYEMLRTDKLEIFLFTSDILGVIPFFIQAVYIHPKEVSITQGAQLVLTMMELLITGRILRVIKDIPAIRAIRISLSKSAGHLVLPLFFFFLFNITSGVFLYFAEPCYDTTTCPWHDLFQSSYYSIVTMTTTGYGNQVPNYELGRFIACCVMIFGALFLSMPLAIIGNEYDKAWCNITEENAIRAELKARDEAEIREALLKRKMPLSVGGGGEGPDGEELVDASQLKDDAAAAAVSDPVKDLIAKEEMEIIRKEHERQAALQSIIMTTHAMLISTVCSLKEEMKTITRINPTILLHYCELRAWLPAFSHHVSSIFDMLLNERVERSNSRHGAGVGFINGSNVAAAKAAGHDTGRRLSVFGGGGGRNRGTVIAPAPSAAARLQNAVQSPSKSGYRGLNAVSEAGKKDSSEDESSDDHSSGSRMKQHNNAMKRMSSDNSKIDDDDDDDNLFNPDTVYRKGSEVRQSDLPKHLRKQQSILFKVLKPPSNRKSMYARVLKAIGVDDVEEIRRRSVSDDFLSRMEKISSNPTTLRSRIWILLELPHSSTEARTLQFIIIFLIAISIFILYTQTITKLTHYGTSTPICGKLLNLYCSDKWDKSLDPGCFVQFANATASDEKMEYFCDHDKCFGEGYNFGSPQTNLTCEYYTHTEPTVLLPNGQTWHTPFQDKEQLAYAYGVPYLFTSRFKMHRVNPVCTRVECTDNVDSFMDANVLWVAAEFTINLIFSVELILRVVVSESVLHFFKDKMNVLDLFAVLPFYIELFNTVVNESFSRLDFSILASSPEPIFIVTMRSLKVFRMFKLTRHFQASKVLSETSKKVWKQILGMLALLAFFVVLFAIFLFEVEGGRACFVGDPGCVPPESLVDTTHIGDRILINKNGDATQFGNVFFGIWFSFVTITTTGYGDITPVTNVGQVMSIFLMIAGTFYMAMPLTAAASTFYQVHEKYQIRIGGAEVQPAPEEKDDKKGTVAAPAVHQNHYVEELMDLRLRLTIKNLIADMYMANSSINDTLKEMQQPVSDDHQQQHKQHHNHRKPSSLLKSITRQVTALERTLLNVERDLMQLVTIHNDVLRRNSMKPPEQQQQLQQQSQTSSKSLTQ